MFLGDSNGTRLRQDRQRQGTQTTTASHQDSEGPSLPDQRTERGEERRTHNHRAQSQMAPRPENGSEHAQEGQLC